MATTHERRRATAARAARRISVLAAVLLLARPAPARAELVLSEVLYDPAGAEPGGEWIEIYNAGVTAIDVGGYALGDEETPAQAEMMLRLPSLSLPPGEALVVARDAALVSAAPGAIVLAVAGAAPARTVTAGVDGWGSTSWTGLANTGDEVLLLRLDTGGPVVVDGIAWGAGATSVGGTSFLDAAAPTGPEGRSLARVDPRGDTDRAVDWAVQVSPTPGVAGPDPCGNGLLNTGEACDDGGSTPGDGCDGDCQVECGFLCAGAGPGSCAAQCGDGDVVPGEACDDGNFEPGDGCGVDCEIEEGFVCEDPAPRCDADAEATVSTCVDDPCLAPLRVSEVHVDGLVDPASEWVEIFNAGAAAIDLGAWALGDEETQGQLGEGLLAFPAGYAIGPGETRIVAASAARLLGEFGVLADFEYGGSLAGVPDLAPEGQWTPGATVSLDDAGDEVVLVCRGAIRDSVAWGSGPSEAVLPPPGPAHDLGHPQHRQTFVRLEPAQDTNLATDWAVSRCPTPGSVAFADLPPTTGRSVASVPAASAAVLHLPARDPEGAALVFALDASASAGSITLLDAALGTARYEAPAGAAGADLVRFTVSDACTTVTPLPVAIRFVAATCDPSAHALRLGEVHVDARVDPGGEWVEIANPLGVPVELSGLRVGDEETLGGDEGLVVFPDGAWVGAGEVVVVAAEAREFSLDFGFLPDFEWGGDTDGDPDNDLLRSAKWSGGAVALAELGDEVYLVGCSGEVIDSVYWGVAEATGYAPAEAPWAPRLAPPSPPYAGEAANGPHTFERLPDPGPGAAGWYEQRCPSPGEVSPATARPIAEGARYPVAAGGTLTGTLSGAGPEQEPLTFELTGAVPAGFSLVDAGSGAFAYAAPPGFVGLTTVGFRVDDGCAASPDAEVTLCVGTAEVPGNGVDEDCDGVVLCFTDADGDGWGSYATRPDDGDGVCTGPGESRFTGDCDDDPAGCGADCSPVRAELCDGRDNDCDPVSVDGADEATLGAACDAPEDADACLDDVRECVGGSLRCVNSPAGDAERVEVCDVANVDEDCDGGADDVDPDGPPATAPLRWHDADGDGYGATGPGERRCDPGPGMVNLGGDCADSLGGCGAACHPARLESLAAGNCADGYDNDCDGLAADADPACFSDVICYPDADGDGFGRTLGAVTLTGPTAGAGCAAWNDGAHALGYWVAIGGDCDDAPTGCGAACRPGAAEVCDERDNDCDTATVDGHDDLLALVSCDSPLDADLCKEDLLKCTAGTLTCTNVTAGDASRVEVCDALRVDEDCDGGADDLDPQGVPSGAVASWVDADGDGWGAPATELALCHPPAGRVTRAGDCDDRTAFCGAACHPGRTESLGAANCNDGWNNDCDADGADQDGACFGLTTCWADADADGYGDPGVFVVLSGASAAGGCAAHTDGLHAAGYWVANALDCADDPQGCGAACAPDRAEVCDGHDNDCDPATGDGAGDTRVSAACDAAADADRCFDDRWVCLGGHLVCQNDATLDTQLVEICDASNLDEDCDGGADDADPDGIPSGAPVWFADRDGDTYGAPLAPKISCERPAGHAANGADCDDDPVRCGASCFPGNPELCDGLNNDCDAGTADGVADVAVNVACDSLADANLCPDEITRCTAGHVTCPDDPVDDDARVERCDVSGMDEDCDGGANDADPEGPPSDAVAWFRDTDGDGHGAATDTAVACAAPAGYVGVGDDCDDDAEACGAACSPSRTESWGDGNCLDGLDNDCAEGPDVSLGCLAETTCWPDFDGDGHGDPATPNVVTGAAAVAGCALWADGVHAVGFWVATADDCDDTEEGVHPGRVEIVGDGVDQDCSGADLCWIDRDNDGYALTGAPTAEAPAGQSCGQAFGLSSSAGDCDDDPGSCGASCRPGVEEICDERDNDCDGSTDGPVCDGVVGPSTPVLYGGSGCGGAPGAADGLAWILALGSTVVGVARATRRRRSWRTLCRTR